MLSTRKQKAKEKRSRQSDVMSDIENLEVVLRNNPNGDMRDRENVEEVEIDLESRGRQQNASYIDGEYRSLWNTILSESSEITA